MAVMTSTPSALICFASLLAAALGCGHGRDDAATDAASLDASCVSAPVRDVAYQALPGVAPALQALDIYPTCASAAPAPVVIWVHGGAWAIGDKGNAMADKLALWREPGATELKVVRKQLEAAGIALDPPPDWVPSRPIDPPPITDAD